MSIRELIASLLCETNIDEEVTASHILKAYGLPDRKVGEWKYYPLGGWHCTRCGEQAPFWCMATTQNLSHFCPSCGAEMFDKDTNVRSKGGEDGV